VVSEDFHACTLLTVPPEVEIGALREVDAWVCMNIHYTFE
jgi:hypothetical protein